MLDLETVKKSPYLLSTHVLLLIKSGWPPVPIDNKHQMSSVNLVAVIKLSDPFLSYMMTTANNIKPVATMKRLVVSVNN